MLKYALIDFDRAIFRTKPVGYHYVPESIVGSIEAKSRKRAETISKELGYGSKNYRLVAASRLAEDEKIEFAKKPILHADKPTNPTPSNPRGAGRKKKGESIQVMLHLDFSILEFFASKPNKSQYLSNLVKQDYVRTAQQQ